MATLPTGTLTPTQSEQTSSKKAVSLIDSLLSTPTLPQGASITPTVQNVQTNELLATPGVTGTVAAAIPTATAPTATAVCNWSCMYIYHSCFIHRRWVILNILIE